MNSTKVHWTTCYIGMGGNVGDVFAAMQWALSTLVTRDDCVIAACSPVYQTPPWGLINQPDFLNCCVAVRTLLDAEPFLDVIQDLEQGAGRIRDIRWGPRTLDIDLLNFGELTIDTDRLTVPHPRMTERGFVMLPLADIAPDLIIKGRKTRDWAAEFDVAEFTETSERLVF